MRWAVEIRKTSLSRRNLADLLQGLQIKLIEGVEYPALASLTINACRTAGDAFEKAKDVKKAFKKIDPQFDIGSVIDYSTNPPSRYVFFESSSCDMTIMGTTTLMNSPPKELSPSELERWRADDEERQYQAKLEHQRSWLEPAYKNPNAAKVIDLLSIEQLSGEAAYKIYELMEGHPNNRKNFHNQLNISEGEFKRFKDTVHNPSVSGDWARHAYHEEPKTPNPMTKDEAELFIRQIAAKWLTFIRRSI